MVATSAIMSALGYHCVDSLDAGAKVLPENKKKEHLCLSSPSRKLMEAKEVHDNCHHPLHRLHGLMDHRPLPSTRLTLSCSCQKFLIP